jgi:uncharacterized protein (TIGR00297 family)
MALGVSTSLAAWRLGALSRSGAVAAAICGGLVFGLGGLPWAVLFLVFFISSSAWSRLFSRQKRGLAEKYSKGSRRDWAQVLANGGLAAGFASLYYFMPDNTWLWVAFAGALAAVNADTWATELGVLSRAAPRSLVTGMKVEPGTSGGVSLPGSLAALGGAALIAVLAVFLALQSGMEMVDALPGLATAVCLGGLAGSFCDSFLGATVQAIYRCRSCGKETERHPVHTCGGDTEQVRGWRWLNNDGVNFACSLVGAGVSLVLWGLVA